MVEDERKERKRERERFQAGTQFKGGKQNKRDRKFEPFEDPDFTRWYHRKGKPQYNNGRDVTNSEQAHDLYEIYRRVTGKADAEEVETNEAEEMEDVQGD